MDSCTVAVLSQTYISMLLFNCVISTALLLLSTGIFIFLGAIWYVKRGVRLQKKRQNDSKKIIGFFHPYCNAGGGGERVLWCAIRAIQLKYPQYDCIVYTGDCDATGDDILKHAKLKFNITLPKKVKFIFLRKREWVEAHHYPYFTLLGQAIGSMVLSYEALNSYVPDVFLDSMGYSMSYFIFKTLAACKVACYVHYPTISTDMLAVVSDRTGSFNNRGIIARSMVLTNLKLLYYHLFAWIYGCAGKRCDVVMVNSTWTKGHIETLWGKSTKRPITKVFPPCDVKGFLEIPLQRPANDALTILSVSQFRPEKNHKLQVQSFSHFLSQVPESQRHMYTLVLAGGCRNEGDAKRIEEIEALANHLEISQHVEIKSNISFTELKQLLASSHVGIHTMNNEHFGIGVVEFQAAGAIALAHRSGGPLMDIVIGDGVHSTGFLAESVEDYSGTMETIFDMSEEKRLQIAGSARKACERFSEKQFEGDFLLALHPLMQ